MKKILLWTAGVLILIGAAAGLYLGPVMSKFLSISLVQPDPNLVIMLGGGGNTVLLKSPDNRDVLIVDTKVGSGAKRLKAYVDSWAPGARVVIVNTHEHADHISGNPLYPGARLITGPGADSGVAGEQTTRLAAGEETALAIGDETVKIRNLGQAHAWDNLVVYLENRKLLATGDLVFNRWIPVAMKQGGTHIGKWMQALDGMLAAYPAVMVVPGHGDVSGRSALESQRAFFADITEAAGDPGRWAALEKKYAGYLSLPGMSGLKAIAALIAEERKQ
ncbi:MAG: MBL fold metallo-hydrolase [candidate division FCPU426 bacterium]